MRKRIPFEERLWARIKKSDVNVCWDWTGGTAGKGYGTLRKHINNVWKFVYAHREVLEIYKGAPVAPNIHALHSCDNPLCCNPNHLSWGTNSKNRREARDRLYNQGNQKLRPYQVSAIRSDTRTQKEIAIEYAVCISTIALIKQNRSWQSA